MPDQLTLDVPAKARCPPRVLMRVVDGGYIDGTGDVARWWCLRCGHETDWQPAPTKVRPPCPRCNVEGLEDEGQAAISPAGRRPRCTGATQGAAGER